MIFNIKLKTTQISESKKKYYFSTKDLKRNTYKIDFVRDSEKIILANKHGDGHINIFIISKMFV